MARNPRSSQITPGSAVVLLCNGRPPSRRVARRAVREADFLLAADGGANTARRLGLTPDLVIGDLDSISAATRRALHASTILHVPRQDNTDLEKALDLCRASRVREVTLLGNTGDRIDMTLGGFSVIWRYLPFMRITLAGDGWRAFPLRASGSFVARKNATVSLIPFSPCKAITLRGLVFPLHNATLKVGEIAVSNVVKRGPFRVALQRGRLLVVVLDEKAEAVR